MTNASTTTATSSKYERISETARSLCEDLTEPPTLLPFARKGWQLGELPDCLRSGEVVLFTAPTQREAESLALTTTLKVAAAGSAPVLVHTAGMGRELFTRQAAEILAGVPASAWDDTYPSTARQRLMVALEQIAEMEIVICDGTSCAAHWYSGEQPFSLSRQLRLIVILQPENISWSPPDVAFGGSSLFSDLGRQYGVPVVLFTFRAMADPGAHGVETWFDLTEGEYVVEGTGAYRLVRLLRHPGRPAAALVVAGASLRYR